MSAKLRKCPKCNVFMYSVKCYQCSNVLDDEVVKCEHCEKESIATNKYFGKNAECPHCEKNNAIFPEVGFCRGKQCPYCFKDEKRCFSFEGGKRNDYTYSSNSKFVCLHCCGIFNHYEMRSFQDDDSSISPIYSPLEVENMVLSKKDYPEAKDLEKTLKGENKYQEFITQLKEYQKTKNEAGKKIEYSKGYQNYREPFKIHNPPKLRKCEACDILIFSRKCHNCNEWLKQSLLSCCHCKEKAIISRELFDKHVECPNCKKSFELVSKREDYQCIYCQCQVTFAIPPDNICSTRNTSTYLCFNCCGINGYTNNDYNLQVAVYSPLDTKKIMLSENDSPQKQHLEKILAENLRKVTTTLKQYDDAKWQYQDEIDPKKKYKIYTEFQPPKFPPLMRCNRCGILIYSLHCHHCQNWVDHFNAKCGHCKEDGIATKESGGYAISCSKCGKRSKIKSKEFSSQSCPYCLGEEKLQTIDSCYEETDKIKKVCLHCCGISIDNGNLSPFHSPFQVKNMFLIKELSDEKHDLKYTLSKCKEYDRFLVRLKRYMKQREHISPQLKRYMKQRKRISPHLKKDIVVLEPYVNEQEQVLEKHQPQQQKPTEEKVDIAAIILRIIEQVLEKHQTQQQKPTEKKVDIAAIILAVILAYTIFALAVYFGN